MRSDDGETWDRSSSGITSAQITALRAHPNGDLYVGTERDGLYRSRDAGDSWERVMLGTKFSGNQVDEIEVNSRGDLFVAKGPISRSTDEGNTWEQLDQWGGFDIAIAPNDDIYVGENAIGIARSKDNGRTWTRVNTEIRQVYALLFLENGDILAGTSSGRDGPEDGVFRSSDGGETWQPMSMVPFNKSIRVLGQTSRGTVFAGPMRSGFYRSEDDGYHFTYTWPCFGYYTDFAATPDGGVLLSSLGGLCLTYDDGLSWTGYDLVFPTDRIYAVEVDSRGFIYVGTDGAGLYRSSRPLTVATESEAVVAENSIGSAYPNPFSSSTTITYSLRQASRVSIDVFDMLGRKVRTLAAGPQDSGTHTISWNAEALASGTYLVRMSADGHVQTLPVTLTR